MIVSAQESIWNFGSGWPSVADIVIRACERVPKVRIFMKNEFWRFSTHFDERVTNSKRRYLIT